MVMTCSPLILWYRSLLLQDDEEAQGIGKNILTNATINIIADILIGMTGGL